MNPRNRSSALWALAAAGGLWAWQNRDKVKGFVNQQRSRLESAQARQYEHNTPMTGETRRIGYDDYNASENTSSEPRTTYDPST